MSVDQEEEELLALCEEIQRLRVANEKLTQGRGASSGAGTTATTSTNAGGLPPGGSLASPNLTAPPVERFVYIQREKRCPHFSGSKSRSDLSICDWIENVESCWRERHMTAREKALFLYDHLEGEAKAAIRFRSFAERENPDTILTILKGLYGSSSLLACKNSFLIGNRKMASL